MISIVHGKSSNTDKTKNHILRKRTTVELVDGRLSSQDTVVSAYTRTACLQSAFHYANAGAISSERGRAPPPRVDRFSLDVSQLGPCVS